MNKPINDLLYNSQYNVTQVLHNFLNWKLTRDELRFQLEKIKKDYQKNAPRSTKTEHQKLISIESLLLKWCGIFNQQWIEVSSYDELCNSLLPTAWKRHKQKTIKNDIIQTLQYMTAENEARWLWIQLTQLPWVILPTDNNLTLRSPNEWWYTNKAPKWFNKVTPIITSISDTLHIDCSDPTICYWFTWSVETVSSRKTSYIALLFPLHKFTLLINNEYWQWTYIISSCIDVESIIRITKQGWQNILDSIPNPHICTCYTQRDPLPFTKHLQTWQEKIIQTITQIIMQTSTESQQDWDALQSNNAEIDPYNKETSIINHNTLTSQEQLKNEIKYRFEIQTYEKLMCYSNQDIAAINIPVWWKQIKIIWAAKLFWHNNKKNNVMHPFWFSIFITKLLNKPSLKTIFKKRFLEQWYETLMWLSTNEIEHIKIPIWGKLFSVVTIQKYFEHKPNPYNILSETGFQYFITKLFNKRPIEQVFKKWFYEQTYEVLMWYTSRDIKNIAIQIGEKSFWIQYIAQYLWNNNTLCAPNHPQWFQAFICQFFHKPNPKRVFAQTLCRIWYEQLMWYNQYNLDNMSITIGNAKFWIKKIAQYLGNNASLYDTKSLLWFQHFITNFFKKPALSEVFLHTFKSLWYNYLMSLSYQETESFHISIGQAKFGIVKIASILWYSPEKWRISRPLWFQHFIHFFIFKKSEKERKVK